MQPNLAPFFFTLVCALPCSCRAEKHVEAREDVRPVRCEGCRGARWRVWGHARFMRDSERLAN
eukprot:2020071-Prymnesium_polylepis.1